MTAAQPQKQLEYKVTKRVEMPASGVPSPSIMDVLRPGRLEIVGKPGTPVPGIRTVMWSSDVTPQPDAKAMAGGELFGFHNGLVFVPYGPGRSGLSEVWDLVFEGGRTVALTRLGEAWLPGLNIALSSALHAGIDQLLFPERDNERERRDRLTQGLLAKGFLIVPFIDIRTVEHRLIPKTFWGKRGEGDYLVIRWQDEPRRSTTFRGLGEKWVEGCVSGRFQCERGFFTDTILWEQVSEPAIVEPILDRYKSHYKEELQKHTDELLKDIYEERNRQVEASGYTTRQLCAEILKRMAPTLETYRQMPELAGAIGDLERCSQSKSS